MNADPKFMEWLKAKAVELQQRNGQDYASIDLTVMASSGRAELQWRAYTPWTGHSRNHDNPVMAIEELNAAMLDSKTLLNQALAFEKEAARLRAMVAGKDGVQ